VRALRQHKGPLATWTAWVAPKNLKVAEAAKQVGIDEATLREVNRIPPHMLVRAGSTLLVPRGEQRQADVSEHLADNAMVAFAPEAGAQRKLVLKAGKRDSVASVARRYRVSATQLAHWNGTSAGARFQPGETILVYVAAKPAPVKSLRKTAATARKPAAKPLVKAARTTKARTRVAAN
jgi:membrane-bound lytic murein transglycosylase D